MEKAALCAYRRDKSCLAAVAWVGVEFGDVETVRNEHRKRPTSLRWRRGTRAVQESIKIKDWQDGFEKDSKGVKLRKKAEKRAL
eukprot:6183834-Pleurochrysis_carterae.AAC.6